MSPLPAAKCRAVHPVASKYLKNSKEEKIREKEEKSREKEEGRMGKEEERVGKGEGRRE